MEAVAHLRNGHGSARKIRLVVDNIRGKKVVDALNILKFTKKDSAYWVEKALISAVANWEIKSEQSGNTDAYDLVISKAFVGGGPVLKRFQPAPHGRAHRIRKRSNHLTLVVSNSVPLPSEAQQEPEAQEAQEA
ncbi:MAG TPA: 50S ribosomal protein L22 [Saprospiraceae bacterium]|nr:50S ribosomal protein L22 [Saprospiraceae bacterium]HNT21184.1 50S ribosomal protein L22 [Saprospiraceae bacterium]